MTDYREMPKAIAEAVGAVMSKVRNVEKHGTNEFHRYKFARVEDLMFQVQPALADAGLVITQDEIAREVMADSLMLATYAFTLSHKSGVSWGPIHQTGMSSLKNSKGGFDDKALNKCHTAARKYFVLGLFQVPAGDLPDADVDGDAPAPAAQQPRPEPKRADPKPPTLKERAEGFAQRMLHVENEAQLNKAWALGEGLRAELDKADPDILAYVESVHADKLATFDRVAA